MTEGYICLLTKWFSVNKWDDNLDEQQQITENVEMVKSNKVMWSWVVGEIMVLMMALINQILQE